MSEADVLRRIQLALSAAGARIFRQNTGLGWVGKQKRVSRPTMVKMEPGDVLLQNARPLHSGLCKGSSDLIGWTPVTVTADMVGSTIGVFTAIECKVESGGVVSEEQSRFISAVSAGGGIAGIARTGEEALEILSGPSR